MREIPRHPSQRGEFVYQLALQMKKDPAIRVVTADLGYGMFDYIRDTYPDRFINVGAAEQAAVGIAVGMALSGLKPFCYSISSFLLWRPAETIRLYLNHEKIAVRMVGGGRDSDYHIDGYSHNSEDAKNLLSLWPNIKQYWPNDKDQIEQIVDRMVTLDEPAFVSLRR